MIGRGASSNPWIFRQIEQFAAAGHYDEPTDFDRYALLSAYFRRLTGAGLPDAIGKMKQFASLFTHGVRNGAELRRQVHTGRTTQEVLDRVDEFFARQRTTSKPALLPSPRLRRLWSKPSLAPWPRTDAVAAGLCWRILPDSNGQPILYAGEPRKTQSGTAVND